MTEDEMVGWHHQLNGCEFVLAPGVGEGQGSLACQSPRGRKELDMTEQLNNNNEWSVAGQAPLSMGFSRQGYWSGLPCPPAGHLSSPRIKPMSLVSPVLASQSFTTSVTWGSLQAKSCQRLDSSAARSEGWYRFSLRSLRQKQSGSHLDFTLLASRPGR